MFAKYCKYITPVPEKNQSRLFAETDSIGRKIGSFINLPRSTLLLSYVNLLYNRLMFLMERGIIEKWYEQPKIDKKMCLSNEDENRGLEPWDLFAVLLVAGYGVGLAAVVLVFEICKYKVLSHNG